MRSRVDQPQVTESDLVALATGNSAFAFDLYGALHTQEGNLFYSPYSVSLVLAMAYAGARGETEAQKPGRDAVRHGHARCHG